MNHEQQPILQMKSVRKSFGSNLVLDDVSLDLNEHDIIVLCGPSGGGKSTLIRTINGLEPLDAGEILYRGEKVDQRTLHEVRKHIGMVFQQFNLFHNLSVKENLIVAPVKVLKKDKTAVLEKAQEYMDIFGIGEKMDAYPHELSGGQKQRVAIVRSLLMEPDIVLLDEPTSALDPEMIKEVLDAIRRLSSMGMTMIIVSHEMAFAREVATRMCFLESGKILVNRPTEEFFTAKDNPRLQQFLSMILTQ